MTLIKCKECGTDVSSKAKTCPKCGVKVAANQSGCGTLIGVIILGGIIYSLSSIFGGSSPPPTASKNSMEAMIDAARVEANKPENNTLESKKRWLREEREIALQEGDLDAVKALDTMAQAPTPMPVAKDMEAGYKPPCYLDKNGNMVWNGGLTFDKYKTPNIYKGKMAKPNVNSSADARMYRTRIKESIKDSPNFAGKYTIATWGCGAMCAQIAVIDAVNGQVFFSKNLKFVVADSTSNDRFSFKQDSNLLIAAGRINDSSDLSLAYYLWDGIEFNLVAQHVFNESDCSSNNAQNTLTKTTTASKEVGTNNSKVSGAIKSYIDNNFGIPELEASWYKNIIDVNIAGDTVLVKTNLASYSEKITSICTAMSFYVFSNENSALGLHTIEIFSNKDTLLIKRNGIGGICYIP
ncbi:MAG: zinc ribbon domain-containing protein [Methylobacter sp.]|nr:zinc ribbon domain-containing protein [Methylobacter sp.]